MREGLEQWRAHVAAGEADVTAVQRQDQAPD